MFQEVETEYGHPYLECGLCKLNLNYIKILT